MVLSIKETRALLNDPSLTDDEAEQIRNGFRLLVELIFDKWFEEKKIRPKPRTLSAKVQKQIDACVHVLYN